MITGENTCSLREPICLHGQRTEVSAASSAAADQPAGDVCCPYPSEPGCHFATADGRRRLPSHHCPARDARRPGSRPGHRQRQGREADRGLARPARSGGAAVRAGQTPPVHLLRAAAEPTSRPARDCERPRTRPRASGPQTCVTPTVFPPTAERAGPSPSSMPTTTPPQRPIWPSTGLSSGCRPAPPPTAASPRPTSAAEPTIPRRTPVGPVRSHSTWTWSPPSPPRRGSC